MGYQIKTPGDLKIYIWRSLPPVRRTLVGKAIVNEIVDAALLEFPDQELIQAIPDGKQQQEIEARLLAACKRHYCAAHGEDASNVGAIWTILVIEIAKLAIVMLVRWWWESVNHRELLAGWRRPGRRDRGE